MDKSGLIQAVTVFAVIASAVLAWLRYRRPATQSLQRERVAPSLHQGLGSDAGREDSRRSPSL